MFFWDRNQRFAICLLDIENNRTLATQVSCSYSGKLVKWCTIHSHPLHNGQTEGNPSHPVTWHPSFARHYGSWRRNRWVSYLKNSKHPVIFTTSFEADATYACLRFSLRPGIPTLVVWWFRITTLSWDVMFITRGLKFVVKCGKSRK